MKKLKKAVVYTLVFALVFHVALVITGNSHVYKVLVNTILKGRLSPSIDEYTIYYNRAIAIGNPQPWQQHKAYNSNQFTQKEEAIHSKYQTVAFCIIKDNQLLFERYYENYSDTSLTNSWSMAKTIISVLIGSAIKEGAIESIDEKVEKYLPHLQGSGLTIKHLLAMSSDINFSEQYINPFGFAAKALYGKDNLNLVKKYKPRGNPMNKFDYQSGNTLLLSYVLKEATGKTVSEYASEKLWKPLGAEHIAQWSLDDKGGNERAFCCFNSNATDFARIGQLYLNNGIWKGDTLIDPMYVKTTTSFAPLKLESGETNERYAYHWWATMHNGEKIFYARGINGQYIFVIPSQNAVVVRLGRKRDKEQQNGVPLDAIRFLEMGYRLSEKASAK